MAHKLAVGLARNNSGWNRGYSSICIKNKLMVFSMNENVLHEKQNVINENIEQRV